jgi:protein-export membrane protein SecD
MLYFAKWKIGLILLAIVAGIFYALPNVVAPFTDQEDLPGWWQPVTLGLDLQGGSHLLLEVGVDDVVQEQMTSLVEAARGELRDARIRYRDLGVDGHGVQVRIPEESDRDTAERLLAAIDPTVEMTRDDDLFRLVYSEKALAERRTAAVQQSIEIVRRRVDELGTREPSIQRQGERRIIVELPGIDDPERVKRLIGKTAKLTFHLVDGAVAVEDALRGRVPPGDRLLPAAESNTRGPSHYVVQRRVNVSGDRLTDAQPTFQNGEPVVSFRFDTVGGRQFGDTTQKNVGKFLAIVLDGQVISAPVIREPILGGSGIISGSFTTQGAQDLALLLRAGALPAPLSILEERTVGPGLGADSIAAGAAASVLGIVLVVVFMAVAYGTFGVLADVALLVNLGLLFGVLSLLGATLTLPGIAGIVLTIGMAVDANVLIFERIREEARHGRTPMNAAEAGFKQAFRTIFDSNITTLAAAALLFFFGTGPVRGFAVTLSVGILTSVFTAVMLTRLMVALWFRRKRPQALPI